MNRQIRRLGVVLALLFLALFVNLNYLQVVRADKLQHDPRNGRIAFAAFTKPRGQILAADGTVLARSMPVNDQFKFLRQYPTGQLFGQITGFFSFTYGEDGVERTFNADLTAHRPTNLTNLRQLITAGDRTSNVTLTLTPSCSRRRRPRSATARGRSSPSIRGRAPSSPCGASRRTTPTRWPSTTVKRCAARSTR